MPIDSTKKSSRFLQSRRYTHDTLTDAQEAFTSVLDINASEIYTDQNLIPSSGLPFSGSAQNGSIYTSGGQNVMKYWYRQPMTKSDLNNEVWFFLNPTGSSTGIGAQLLDANQQINFISPKYAVPSLTNANTEDATPGYGVKVLIDGTQQSVNNYAFDYKTGVLEFASAILAPTAGQVVYISAYQYVGRTLLTYNTGSFSGSFTGTFSGTSSYASQANSSSYAVSSSYSLSSSYAATSSFANNFTVAGTLTVQRLVAQTITSSVDFVTGSTHFGSIISNTHEFTGSVSISGSLVVNNNSVITSNQTSSMSVLSASYASGSTSASYALSASYAATASYIENVGTSSVAPKYTLTSSFQTYTSSINSYTASVNTQLTNIYASESNYTPTASFNAFTSSYNSGSFSGSFKGNGSGLTNISASAIVGLQLNQIASGSVTASVSPAYGFSVNASSSISGAFAVSSSGVAGAFKGSGSGMFTVDGVSGRLLTVDDRLTGTLLSVVDSSNLPILEIDSSHKAVVSGSLIVTSGVTGSLQGTSSWALNTVSSSYTLSSSYGLSSSYAFSSSYAATSSFADNFLVAGTITAQRLVVQTISSSVVYSSGSNIFGNSLANQQILSGSVRVVGTLEVNGSPVIVTSQTSSMVVLSSSYANNATSASYSLTASYWSGSIATSSYSVQSLSASLAQIAISASYATTASYAMNAGGGGVSAIYISDENILQGTSSYFNFTGSGVIATISNGTASISIPGAGSVISQNVVLNQTSPATTWSFSHNLGTLYPVFTIFDNNDDVIIPKQIHANTINDALIYFSSPRTGHAVASLGGVVNSSSYSISSSYAYNADLLDGIDSTRFATTSSNVFIGNQTVSGSLFTSGSNQLIGTTQLTGSLGISGSEIIQGYIQFMPVTANVNDNVSASYIYVSGSTQDLYFTQNGNGYNNTTRLRWLESNLYTGILYGGTISSTPGSTTFNISSGSGMIVKMNATTGSDPFPTVKQINWPTYTNQPIINSGSAKLSYVGLNNTGQIVQQTVPWGSTDIDQWDTQINLGVVLHLSGSVSSGVFNSPQISYGASQKTDDFTRAFGPLKISGHVLQPSGSTLSLIKGSGTSYREGANYANNPNHPSTVTENAITTSKIYRYYLSGSTPIIDTGVANAGYTVIDPSKYVDTATGTLSSVPGGSYSIQRVFWVPGAPTNAFLVYYGNDKYNSSDTAVTAIASEPFTEAPNTAQNAILVAYIVVSGGESNLQNANIIQGGLFRSINGIGASGTPPVSNTLAGLSDVSVPFKATGDLLYYNGSQWVNNKQLTGNYGITGSLGVTSGITGNLTGTASYASQSVSSSYTLSSSYSLSSSYAYTASYSDNFIIGSALETYGTLASSSVGSNTVFTKATGSYTAAFFKYTVSSGSNARVGEVFTVWNGNNVEYADVTTNDIGTTINVTGSAALSSGNVQFIVQTNSGGWKIKTIATFI